MACKETLKNVRYLWLALCITITFALLEIWLASFSIILFVFHNETFAWRDRLSILWSAVVIFFDQFTLTSQIITILIAILIGLNITLLIYYFRKRLALERAAGTSVIGIFLSLVGVGCTSCGSIVLSSVLGFSLSTKVLTALPLRGTEFNLFAILILLTSIFLITQKISGPLTCKIKNNL